MFASLALLPVVIPLAATPIALLLSRWPRWQSAWTLGALATALGSSALLLAEVWRRGEPAVIAMGGWQAPFGIVLVGDLLSATFAVMAQAVLLVGALYAAGSRDKVVSYPTFYPLFLTLTVGLTGSFLTGDLFNLFVFSEVLVFSGAILTANADDPYGTEAALKYLYISLLASTALLLAAGALYVSYGTLNMADLAARIAAAPDRPLLAAAIALLAVTFMVKSAVFPFHFWQPDFHAAAPTAVSAMLSSVVVKVGVYGFLRMTTLLVPGQAPWLQPLLVALGIVGVVYGGLSAIGTHNVKRMLAYSTLAQIGFILVAIGWGTPLALAAAVIFTVNHSLVKAAMLMLAGFVASRAPVKTASFAVVQGMGKAMPAAGALFFVGGMALAGIPPTNGFVSKMTVFRSGVEAEQWWPLFLLGVASILTLIYVVRAFMRIWWQANEGFTYEGQTYAAEEAKPKPYGDRLVAPALLILAVLALGLWPAPLVNLATAVSRWMGDPTPYVVAVLGG